MYNSIIWATIIDMAQRHEALNIELINGKMPALIYGSGSPSALYLTSLSGQDKLSPALLLKFLEEFLICAENDGEMEGVRIKPAISGRAIAIIPYISAKKDSLSSIAYFIKSKGINNVFLIKSKGNSICSFSSESAADTAATVCDILKACAGFEKSEFDAEDAAFLRTINNLTSATAFLLCTEEIKFSSLSYFYKKYREPLMISALI